MAECLLCEGGWRPVSPQYADQVAKQRPDYDPNNPSHVRELSAQRASATNTVYPCKVCMPVQFFRWRLGCLDSGHPGCVECSTTSTRKRVGITVPPDPEPDHERKDLL